ncbi:hypothetical protein OBBRIDRAFT_861953 [Obba rivulosa]|uniref:WD40 repeat-like protein n=1 Tax=Obba rivulosa TaxID=1052685 RepID=A0A8E2J835_9APHY|nr:hypothetical protein OBBRIDRAFT_861953 [Obba rivulosa]
MDPWFRGPKATEPFKFVRSLNAGRNTRQFHCMAAFPWDMHAMADLWGSQVTDEKVLSGWKGIAEDWMGAVAVGSTGALLILPKLASAEPITIRLPDDSQEVQCIAWALSPDDPLDPLIIYTVHSVIFILDLKLRKIIGKLRGHGGLITSIAVHPIHPYLFCTTSRDFTARIYDLTLPATQKPNNPHWPPRTHQSLAGPAHGFQLSEPEGEGLGQCVIVLVGGRAGGHRGAVLHAAFHHSLPLIATCGVDRAVKLWCIPSMKRGVLAREDKPLFSTDYIHRARILSVTWLSIDILVTHSAPALMLRDPDDDTYYESGTITVWRWLGLNRFFPAGKPIQKIMRSCASDYRNSETFGILSSYFLPLTSLNSHVYTSSTNESLLSISMGRAVHVFNITQFDPRLPPACPPSTDDVAELTRRLRLSDDDGKEGREARRPRISDDDGGDGEEGRETRRLRISDDDGGEEEEGREEGEEDESPDESEGERETRKHAVSVVSGVTDLFENDGWTVRLPPPEPLRADLPDIDMCEMACGGTVMFGASKTGTLFVWKLNSP